MVDVDARHVEDALGLVRRLLEEDSFERSYVDAARAALDRLLAVLKEQADRIERLGSASDDKAVRVRGWQLPACARCSQGVFDTTNVHWLGACKCDCHVAEARCEAALPVSASEASRLLTERDAALGHAVAPYQPEGELMPSDYVERVRVVVRHWFDRAIEAEAALVARDAELAERMTRESGLALIEDARRWQRAYENARDEQAALSAKVTQLRAERDTAVWMCGKHVSRENVTEVTAVWGRAMRAERLAHDRGEALREARAYVCEWPIGTTDDPQEQDGGPRDVILQVIDEALAGVVPPEQET